MSPSALLEGRLARLVERTSDFSLGIIGRVSDTAGRIRHVKRADNVIFDDPLRALGVRPGYGDIVDATLPFAPHSLMMFYAPGVARGFVGAGTKIYEIIGGGGYVEQALPSLAYPYTERRWSHTNINGVLVATQEGGTNAPIAFNGTGWLSLELPVPTPGMAIVPAAGGAVDAGQHFYRVRWIFRNGSGVAGTAVSVTTAGGNLTAAITGVPLSTRSDFIGWQLERTKVGEPTLWYVVAPLIGPAVTTYNDAVSDGSLGDLVGAEPGVHGTAPHFEGVVNFKDRLLGWAGTTLYCSRAIGDEEGSGVFNFHPLQQYPVRAGDGDDIVQCLEQVDRLVMLKGQRAHALLGFDPDSFQVVTIPGALGCASTRGATAHGSRVWWYAGFGRIFMLNGNEVSQVGKIEVGEYLEDIAPTDDDEVVMGNDGQRVFMAYRAEGEAYNRQAVSYNIPHRQWEHHTEMRIADMIFPKRRSSYGGARLLFADPKVVAPASDPSDTSLEQSFFAIKDTSGSQSTYYVQKLNVAGAPLFPPGGVISSASDSGSIFGPVCVADASGGVIVFGEENRAPFKSIVAHRISAAGAHLWNGLTGIVIFADVLSGWTDFSLRCVPDGAGGAILAWADNRESGVSNIYVQRLDANGNAMWAAGGLKVSTGNLTRMKYPSIVPDGSGGCYVSWRYYDGAATPTIYAQRVSPTGFIQWAIGGVVVSADTRYFERPAMCASTDGGVLFACETVSGTLKIIKVSPAGAIVWASVNLTSGFGNATLSEIVSDKSGGAIALFVRPSGGGGLYSTYAVRVRATGVPDWGSPIEMLPIAQNWSNAGRESGYAAVEDGGGGVILLRQTITGTNEAMWMQRINISGALQMGNGVAVSPVSGTRAYVPGLISDGQGGAIAGWDVLGGGQPSYVARVNASGSKVWVPDVNLGNHAVLGTTARHSAFRGAPDGQVPTSEQAGYHVWSGWDGLADERGISQSGGTPIPWSVELPDYDGGLPDVEKEFDRIFLLASLGGADLSASVVIDAGPSTAAVPIFARAEGSRWGSKAKVPTADTLIWGQGRWAKSRAGEIVAPLPAGMIGKRARLSLSAQLTKRPSIACYVLDFHALPDRGY